MTATRQERHKNRLAGTSAIEGGVSIFEAATADKVLTNQAQALLATAEELFGARAKGILSTAYMLPDPLDFLRRKVEEVHGAAPPPPPEPLPPAA